MMLDEYSIEQRAAQIFDARTKEYFSEVLSRYAAGNYPVVDSRVRRIFIVDNEDELGKLTQYQTASAA
jgi:hypothetical protein